MGYRLLFPALAAAIAVVALFQFLSPFAAFHPSFDEERQNAEHALLAPRLKHKTLSRVAMSNATAGRATAVAESETLTAKKLRQQQHQQQQGSRQPRYHVVFSTSCSAQMDWESWVFFYHAMKVSQPGNVVCIRLIWSDFSLLLCTLTRSLGISLTTTIQSMVTRKDSHRVWM